MHQTKHESEEYVVCVDVYIASDVQHMYILSLECSLSWCREKRLICRASPALRRFAAHKINKRSVPHLRVILGTRVTCLFVLLLLPGKCSYIYALAAQDVHNRIKCTLVFDVCSFK